MSGQGPGQPVEEAESDPARSRSSSASLLKGLVDPRERVRALHGLAVSCLQLAELPRARRHVADGIALAERHHLAPELAELQATSAQLWFHAERPDRAVRTLDSALEEAPAGAAATLLGQRAHLWFRLGRYDEGLADSERALAALGTAVRSGEALARQPQSIEARVRSNRGLARFFRGEGELALSDLERAHALYVAAGAEALAAQALHNLGYVAGCLGEVPEGLGRLEEAAAEYERLGLPAHQLVADRAMLLLSAGLLAEARAALARAADTLESAGLAGDAAEALLSLAEACLVDEDLPAAEEAAGRAEAAFRRQDRYAWAALALDVRARSLRTTAAERDDWDVVVTSAVTSAERLERAGWPQLAAASRIEAATAAVAAGRTGEVDAVLRGLGVPPADAVLDGEALALRRLAAGRPEQAMTALREALEQATRRERVLDIGAVTMAVQLGGGPLGPGSVGMASRSLAGTVAGVSQLGIVIAAATDSPAGVLEWAEAARGLRSAAMTGGADGPAASLAALLRTRLRGRVLVEYVIDGRSLLAVVVRGGADGTSSPGDCLSVERLGSLAEVERAAASLHFAIRGLVGREGASGLEAVADRALARLDEIVGAPVRSIDVRAPLLLVPDGVLAELPFGLLPAFSRRHFLVLPSARACLPGEPPHIHPPRRVLVVAGPGLPAARDEAARVAEVWIGHGDPRAPGEAGAGVELLDGPGATFASLASRWTGCDLVHLAVHGSLRLDNPALSTFRFADGEVTVHELRRLGAAPAGLVMTACDAGRIGTRARGATAGGPVARLLGGWAIASVAPLRDEAMPLVAERLHERLAAGDDAASALRALRVPEETSDATGSGAPAGPGAPPAYCGDVLDTVRLAVGCLVPHGRRPSVGNRHVLPGAGTYDLGECPE